MITDAGREKKDENKETQRPCFERELRLFFGSVNNAGETVSKIHVTIAKPLANFKQRE